jgi:predicted nucleotide-binding protein (sugar kinase/HSP70/actin superfamily)
MEMVKAIDECESIIRNRVGFEVTKGSFDKVYHAFTNALYTVETIGEIKALKEKTINELKALPINKPKNCLRVGIIGEYYTVMEPYSNHFIEKELADNNIEVSRKLNISSTFITDTRPALLKNLKKYMQYEGGATTVYTINDALDYAEQGYDGIIHLKSFGCTPEVDMMPILHNISEDYKIPILYLSFDSQTSETGIKTRLEAFNDMIVLKKLKQVTKEIE